MTSDKCLTILKNVSIMARAEGTPVTDTHKSFLIKLIDYLEEDSTNGEFTFAMSLDDISRELCIPKRTVVSAVDTLTAAGVLIREPDNGRRHGKGLNPMITTINKAVFV